MPVSYKRKNSGSFYQSNKRPRYKSPRPGFWDNLGRVVTTAVTSAAPYAYNYLTSRTKTTSGTGITSQYDRKVVYRKKYMPRRKKRQWMKFAKKVNAVAFKDIGTKTVVRNNQLTVTSVDATQNWASICLYGKDGASAGGSRCGMDDMKQIVVNDPDMSNPTAKAIFKSGILDITVMNGSTVTEGNNNGGVEVDVYELQFKKIDDAVSIGTLITNAENNTDAINALNPQLSLTQRGVTLFDLPDFCAQGVTILKKTKYFLGIGETFTYQYRDPRNFTIRRDNIDDTNDDFILPYKTRGFLILMKGVPTANPDLVVKTLQIGVTRKYSYKVLSNKNTDADNQIP